MPTIKDVADLANVSTATVSRAVSRPELVSQETLLKVQQAISKIKYIPNANARRLVNDDNMTVGVVLSELADPFYATLVHEVEKFARQFNITVLISTGSHSTKKETDAIRRLQADGCNAIIIYSIALSDQELLKLSSEVKGLIILNRHISEIAARCLNFDNQAGAELAADYLFNNGHKNIAVVSATNKPRDAQNRLSGIRNAFIKRQIQLKEEYITYGESDFLGGQRCAEVLLSRALPITAILCFNDSMAVGVIAKLKQQGFQVPNDISVIGFDDLFIAKKNFPPLTTVHYPVAIIAQKAIELAWGIISENSQSNSLGYQYFPILKVRSSTLPLREHVA